MLIDRKARLQKGIVSIRFWLLGRGYHDALRAMEFAALYHTGLRKDGVTPEFEHQISAVHFTRTLDSALLKPQETYTVLFLHDITEDKDVSLDAIKRMYGEHIAHSVWLMDRKSGGAKKELKYYYEHLADDPVASIGKGADRIHNLQTIPDVFTHEGQKWYIEETETYILPMLKRARRHFPRQEPAYENIKHALLSQIELIQKIHASIKETV